MKHLAFHVNFLWNISSVSLAKWSSVRSRTKWLRVQISLQSQYFHPTVKQIFGKGDLTNKGTWHQAATSQQGTPGGRQTKVRERTFKSIWNALVLARSLPLEEFFWIYKYAVDLLDEWRVWYQQNYYAIVFLVKCNYYPCWDVLKEVFLWVCFHCICL